METIEVTSAQWKEPAFKTAAEAIIYRSPRAVRAASDNLLMKGSVIDSAKYNDTALRLWLSDRRILRIYLEGRTVEWELLVGPNQTAIEPCDEPAPCLLKFVNSQLAGSVWNRPSLLQPRVGRTIGGIWTGKQILFLYVAETKSLMFSALERLPQKTPLLYWEETH